MGNWDTAQVGGDMQTGYNTPKTTEEEDDDSGFWAIKPPLLYSFSHDLMLFVGGIFWLGLNYINTTGVLMYCWEPLFAFLELGQLFCASSEDGGDAE